MPTVSHHNNTNTNKNTVNVHVNVTAPPRRRAKRRASAPAATPVVVGNPSPAYTVTPQAPLGPLNDVGGPGGSYIPHQSSSGPDSSSPSPPGFSSAITNREASIHSMQNSADALSHNQQLHDTYSQISSTYGHPADAGDMSVAVPSQMPPLIAPPPAHVPPTFHAPEESMGQVPAPPSSQGSHVSGNTMDESEVYGTSVVHGNTVHNMAGSEGSVHPMHQDVQEQAVVPFGPHQMFHPHQPLHNQPIVEEPESMALGSVAAPSSNDGLSSDHAPSSHDGYSQQSDQTWYNETNEHIRRIRALQPHELQQNHAFMRELAIRNGIPHRPEGRGRDFGPDRLRANLLEWHNLVFNDFPQNEGGSSQQSSNTVG